MKECEVVMILTTVPTREVAQSIASHLLRQKLAACIQFNEIRSMYLWEGEIADEPEVRLLIKTASSRLSALNQKLKELHPYSVPQIAEVKLDSCNAPYAQWVEQALSGS